MNNRALFLVLFLTAVLAVFFFFSHRGRKPHAPIPSETISNYNEEVIINLSPADKERVSALFKEIYSIKDTHDKAKLEKIRERFLKITKEEPDLVWGYIGLSQAGNQIGRFDEAEEAIKKAAKMDPDNWFVWYCFEDIYNDTRVCRYKDAVDVCEKWIKASPRSFDAYFSMSEAYNHLGKKEKSLWCLKKAALDCDIKYVDMINIREIVVILLENNEKEIAKKLLDRLDNSQVKSHKVYSAYGAYYDKLSDLEKAEEYYKKAIETQPDFQLHYINLASIYFRDREFDKALKLLEKAKTIPPHPDLRVDLELYGMEAEIYIEMGEREKAEETLDTLLKNSIGAYGIDPESAYLENAELNLMLNNT